MACYYSNEKQTKANVTNKIKTKNKHTKTQQNKHNETRKMRNDI